MLLLLVSVVLASVIALFIYHSFQTKKGNPGVPIVGCCFDRLMTGCKCSDVPNIPSPERITSVPSPDNVCPTQTSSPTKGADAVGIPPSTETNKKKPKKSHKKSKAKSAEVKKSKKPKKSHNSKHKKKSKSIEETDKEPNRKVSAPAPESSGAAVPAAAPASAASASASTATSPSGAADVKAPSQ
ncbi:hypothetical protein QR680_010640 [Steinernema hermaphroditum]|uniref:Uncharacterized protein n=1 Tax=Steinernema hermaphroditum TaxID=289476 RepID=A0AA39IS28_9BILA|nr:hypothetical protein QR680_010640 [Steinernema hermaphroditum]